MQVKRIGWLALGFGLSVLGACRPDPQPAPAAGAPEPATPGAVEHPPTSLPPTAGALPPGELPAGHPPVGNSSAPSGRADGFSVGGTVDAPPQRTAQIKEGALFFIARNAKTRQIVAVRREGTWKFPMQFRLSAADAMVQGTPFEGPFDITVRWSKTGDAMPGAGDIEGTARGVAVGTADLDIRLSEVRQ